MRGRSEGIERERDMNSNTRLVIPVTQKVREAIRQTAKNHQTSIAQMVRCMIVAGLRKLGDRVPPELSEDGMTTYRKRGSSILAAQLNTSPETEATRGN